MNATVAAIRRLFGNTPRSCGAMDAWEAEKHPRGKGGKFAKGSGGASSPAKAAPTKPTPKKDVSAQAHAAAKAKLAEIKAKPKKPAKPKKAPSKAESIATPAKPKAVKAEPKPKKTDTETQERADLIAELRDLGHKPKKTDTTATLKQMLAGGPAPKEPTAKPKAKAAPKAETPAPKAEAPAPKKANPNLSAAKRAATALQKFEAGLEGKSASEIRKLEAQHIELLDKANASAKKAGVPTNSFEKKGKTGKSPSKPKAAKTEGGKQEAAMRASFSTINSVAKSVPQKLEDAKSYSPDWRHLLQTVRNMDASPHLGAVGMESIRKAARGIKPVPSGEHAAAERNALLAALKKTKASKPKAPKKPSVS